MCHITHRADEAIPMPLKPQGLHHRLRHGLPALPTLGTIPIRMTPHTPRVPVLLHERRAAVEGIPALRAEEVADVPFGAAGDDDFALDGRFAALAARAEELVEVEVAVEAERGVAVGDFELQRFVCIHVFVTGEMSSRASRSYALHAFASLLLGLRVEGDEFEVGVAFVADEAFGVEALACCAEDAAGDGEGAVGAEGSGLTD